MSTSSALPPPVDPHLTFLILLQWLSLERVWVGLGRRQAGSCVHTLPSYLASFHSLYILWLSILHIFCFSPFLLFLPLLSSFLIPSPFSTTLFSSLPTLLPSFLPLPFLSTLPPPYPSLLFLPSSFLSFTCTNCFCCGRHYLGVFILCRIQSSGEDFSDMYGGGTMFTRQPNLLITAYLYILTNST